MATSERMSVVTLSEWEGELRQLRSGLGPLVEMRMKHWLKFPLNNQSGLKMLVNPDTENWLALYDLAVGPKSTPRAVIQVRSDEDLHAVAQGLVVRVAGRPEPGGAVVVVLPDGRQLWPVYPATYSNSRRHRWENLTG